MITTAGKAIINAYIPKEYREWEKPIDKKVMGSILTKIAKAYPQKYPDINYKLKRIGAKVAYIQGSSFSLDDFKSPIDKSILEKEEKEVSKTKLRPENVAEFIDKYSNLQKDIEKRTIEAGVKNENGLAFHAFSGARGDPSSLASLISSPVMYMDNLGKPIPTIIKHSYSEGLDPVEYWSSSYGTRKGNVATKFATPEGGAFNKEVSYLTGDVLITEDDCHTNNGIKVDVADSENIGRLLATQADKFQKDSVLTDRVISDLVKAGIKKIIIRSPITCQAQNGICKKCYGFNERGVFPDLGDNVGINSAAALTEQFTQGAMKEKHTGGVISKQKSGFKLIQQLLEVPKVFVGEAISSSLTGTVTKIEDAPQGGWFVYVNDYSHYVPPDRKVLVKIGDKIETGKQISDGTINPSAVTAYRGLGEGRKMLADSLKKAYVEDGKNVNKVHMEVLARSSINNVIVGDHRVFSNTVPGDVIPVSRAQEEYEPVDPKKIKTKDGIGKYLAKPYLHYTIGTRLEQSMLDDLEDSGIKDIEVTDYEPPFMAIMTRLEDAPSYKDNWIARLYSNRLKDKLMESTARGDKAKMHGTHFIPPFIYGVEFGKPKIGY